MDVMQDPDFGIKYPEIHRLREAAKVFIMDVEYTWMI